jgi:hypothetical protein
MPQGCNVVTPIVPITTTLPLEGTPMPLTILMILLQTTLPQLDTELFPMQQQAYQEEQ